MNKIQIKHGSVACECRRKVVCAYVVCADVLEVRATDGEEPAGDGRCANGVDVRSATVRSAGAVLLRNRSPVVLEVPVEAPDLRRLRVVVVIRECRVVDHVDHRRHDRRPVR